MWSRLSRLSVVVWPALLSGCVVSFDGYEYDPSGSGGTPDASAGAGGGAGSGGSAGAGGGSGGLAGAGGAVGGSAGAGGATGGTGGTGGGTGGTGGGTGGTGGGTGGTGGGTGGTGGATGGTGGGTGGTGGATGGTGGATGGTGGVVTCPEVPGTALMRDVPKPGGGIYCIDRTEVTQSQYAAFLSASPSTAGQVAGCSTNSSYTPTNCGQPFEPAGKANDPVFCVDWCDAYAYCAFVGKRLCGSVDGGSLAATDRTNPSKSQWHRACTMAGQRQFPYGSVFSTNACNGAESSTTLTIPVGDKATCQGGYSNIFDMSGNVREWEDACSGTTCPERGGGYLDFEAALRCDSAALVQRMSVHKERGFRCCADP
ncbi:MAG: SUMF1/EgtB/PvdO family nonheme iron enzyme [Polyangiaceae bacterium]|nr:SUMF1/EgtB/PvdO family nonheme iron enzyme [Polyangiaceae bacterium]